MRQPQGHHLQVAELERAGDDVRFGNKVALRPRPVVEGVAEHAPQVVHGCLVGIDGQRLAAAQVAEAAAVVQTHDMIGVGVGEQHRVQPLDLLAQHLEAELGGGINHQLGLLGRHIDLMGACGGSSGWPGTRADTPGQ